MDELRHMLFAFSGLLLINATLAAVLFWRQRSPLYRTLFLLWACSIASGLLQALVASAPWMVFAFGASALVISLLLVDLARRALDLGAAFRAYGVAFAAGLGASVLGALARAPFWVTALPIALGATLPLLDLVRRALARGRDGLSTTGWAAVLSIALYALHQLDYPFLRDDPRFAPLGFTLAMLAVFAVSITAPAIILERTAAERQRMEREVLQLNEQLQQRVQETLGALRARDEFLCMAAHELRTPLTALRLQIQSAQRDTGGRVPVPERLGVLDRLAGRMGDLVNRLLDLSRITAHRFDLEYVDADLSALVREIALRMQPEVEHAGSTLTLALARSVPGRWDPLRIEQLLGSLLSNAIKFGAGKPIEVSLEDLGDAVQLRVRDHGIGIAPEQQARIFQPFERASVSRNYGGLGLGLWISAQIVKAHGGTIAVDSRPGEGAAFTISLPKQPLEDGAALAARAPAAPSTSSASASASASSVPALGGPVPLRS